MAKVKERSDSPTIKVSSEATEVKVPANATPPDVAARLKQSSGGFACCAEDSTLSGATPLASGGHSNTSLFELLHQEARRRMPGPPGASSASSSTQPAAGVRTNSPPHPLPILCLSFNKGESADNTVKQWLCHLMCTSTLP